MLIIDDKIKRTKPRKGKPVKAPVKTQLELARQIRELWRDVILPVTEELKGMVANGATPAQLADRIDRALVESSMKFSVAVPDIVDIWKLACNDQTRRSLERTLTHALGIDLAKIIDDPSIAHAAQLGAMEAANLIVTIPQQYLGQVAKSITDNFAGRPLPENRTLLQQIQSLSDISRKRAMVIARDQTHKLTTNIDRLRQESIGIKMYIWRTMKDNSVVGKPGGIYPKGSDKHGNHYKMEGMFCRWDDPTVYSKDGKRWATRPADVIDPHPGHGILCFPGDSYVNLSNGCHKLFRSWYDGELTTLITDTGESIKATVNHPILTQRGWLPINSLNDGDYVVQAIGDMNPSAKNNDGQFVVRFDDLFKALSQFSRPLVARGNVSDFYGDGSKKDVDIIDVDGLLLNYGEPAFSEGVGEFLFPYTRTTASVFGQALRLLGVFSPNGGPLFGRHVSARFMSLFGALFPLFGRHLCHAGAVAFGDVSHRDFVFNQNFSDEFSINIKTFGNLSRRFQRQIPADDRLLRKTIDAVVSAGCFVRKNNPPGTERLAEVVRVASQEGCQFFKVGEIRYKLCRIVKKLSGELFSGHVYTLHSFTGYYSIGNGGFQVKNCRCYSEAVIDPKEISKFARMG